jgi:hypothetical protein
VAAFVVVSIQHTLKVLTPSRLGTYTNGAVARWLPQLQELDAGVDIWATHHYPNPPIMALLLWPFTALPPVSAALTWLYIKVILALLALRWTFALVADDGVPCPPWAQAAIALLSVRPILGDLSHGNVNLFILFLVIAALTAYRHQRDGWAGLALALAIACKVTPALFVPYFLWKRSWRVLAGCAAGSVLFVFIIPSCVLGIDGNLTALNSWLKGMVLPYTQQGIVWTDHNNQSLPAFAYRMLTDNPSFSTYVNDIYTPTRYHNFVAWPVEAVRWLVKGCMLAFCGLIVWTCRTPTQPRARSALAAEFALVILGMLLFSERTWKHHCVTLVLPFAVLVYTLATQTLSTGERIGLVSVLVGVSLLIASTSTALVPQLVELGGRRAVGMEDVELVDEVAKLAQTYGAYVWAFLLLLGAVSWRLRSSPH